MRKEKVLRIENFANLYLQIFTIGYPDEGESVITMLFDKSTPLLTIVTDCYCTTLCHAVKKILEKYGNPHIDAFVWTHPHEDHSLGIQDLLDANDPGRTTRIFLSDGVMALDEANVKYLKIPHHGSDEPSKFLKVLRQNHVKLTDAVTTVKKTSKLPNQKVLNEYKKIAENVSSTSEGINAVGCVACIYKIQPFNANRHLVGNARMIN